MLHDSLSENFFEILFQNGAQYIGKSNISQFPNKNLFLELYGPNLTQRYTTCITSVSLVLLVYNCSRNF